VGGKTSALRIRWFDADIFVEQLVYVKLPADFKFVGSALSKKESVRLNPIALKLRSICWSRSGLLLLALFLCALSFSWTSAARAQDTAAEVRKEALTELAIQWNRGRNEANVEKLAQLFHPDERDLAREYYRDEKEGATTVKIVSIQAIAGKRFVITVDRSWTGSRPGKSRWTLEASEVNGQWFLRMPGGSLKASPQLIAQARSRQESARSLPIAEPKDLVTSQPLFSESAVVREIKPPPPPAPAKADAANRSEQSLADQKADPRQKLIVRDPGKRAGVTRFDDWSRVCQKNSVGVTVCYVETLLLNPENRETVFLWRLAFSEQRGLFSLLRSPAGVMLSAGLTLHLNPQAPSVFAYDTCYDKVCEVSFVIGQDLLKALVEQPSILAKFVIWGGENVAFEIPMKGFAAAVNSLKK
jgi:invasion protein IalB